MEKINEEEILKIEDVKELDSIIADQDKKAKILTAIGFAILAPACGLLVYMGTSSFYSLPYETRRLIALGGFIPVFFTSYGVCLKAGECRKNRSLAKERKLIITKE